MGLRDIIKIIKKNQLCRNWEFQDDDKLLSLYYENYDIYLFYHDGYLYAIFHKIIENNHMRKDLKTKYKQYKGFQTFTYNKDFYIQSKFKRFTNQIILNYSTFYSEICQDLKTLKNDKKTIFYYPYYNVNIMETEQISNYPLPNN